MWWLLKRHKEYDPDVRKGYGKMQLLLFRAVGGYPDLVNGYWFSVFYCTIFYTQLITCTITLIISAAFAVEKKEMDLMSEKIFHCCYLFFYTFALYNTHKQRQSFDDLLRIIGKDFYNYSTSLSDQQSTRMKKDFEYYQRFRNWYTFFLITSDTYMSWILPLVKVASSGNFSTVTNESVPFNVNMPLGMYIPVDTSTLGNFAAIYLLEASLTTYIGILLLNVDITMVNFIHQLSTQINVLTQSVREIPQRARQLYENKNNKDVDIKKCFYKALVENIKHHQVLLQYQKALQDLAVQWLLVLFIGSGVTLCVSGYLIMNMKITSTGGFFGMFMNIMYLTDTLTVIFIYCWFSEKLSISSEEYEEALYSSPWPDQTEDFKHALRIVIAFTQHKDFRLRISKIAVFSLDTFSQILKRAYSYLNVLNATN